MDEVVAGQSSTRTSPRRHFLRKRRAEVINIPPADDEESSTESDSDEDDADHLPDTEKGRQGHVSVKEALGGLFSSGGSISSTSKDLIVVKRYSQGKTLRQRISYVMFKHSKTAIFIRYIILMLTSIMVFLYIAEAISIDILLRTSETRNEGIVLPCFNLTRNYESPNIIDLILVPKPYQIWILQTVLGIFSLFGASFAIYVRQELFGSLRTHFSRNFDIHIFLTVVLGFLFLITLLYPSCLRLLFIPSFLYCWVVRYQLLFILQQANQSSFFRHDTGLRNTAISLITFMICFFISCICVIHHVERLGGQITLFNSYWLTVVTFSTVGYGDVSPGHWSGKLFMIAFIGSALVYLPSKLEKLWNSLKLHRKHYSEYKERGSVKHVILISVLLKPLVIRDFINEFYSDPKQMDTQSVLLLEQEPTRGIKQLLGHQVWSQRITVLLGSGLKVADLARAKARSAEACFILTAKTPGSTEEADRHTILCSWTLKSYAPKCKQYVHIIRPENKMHLHVADEIICERELTNSLLAMNTMCPGISTVASLLMHTFTYEGRRYNHADYQLYEKCSPCEIYQIQLDQSRYFHHFSGKNFLFSSVVAYRKFHVILLGVRPINTSDILFNPGINYIMKDNDTCYYISETQEEYSDYQIVKPTSFHKALWDVTATFGLLSMYMVGVDPESLVNPTHEDEVDGQQRNVLLKRILSERRMSVESLERSPKIKPPNYSQFTLDEENDIGALDPQLTAEVCNWQEEAQIGLQLLKYHGGERHDSKPVVKMNVVPRQCYIGHERFSLPTCPTELKPFFDPKSHHGGELHAIMEECPMNAPEVVVDTLSDEEDVLMMEHASTRPKPSSQPVLRSFLHRSVSHTDTHQYNVAIDGSGHHGHGPQESLRKSSSYFRLNLHKAEAASIQSGVSAVSYKSDTSHQSHVVDPLVVVELDDISEKEELEDLEEGRPHELELPIADDESSPSQSTLGIADDAYHSSFGSQFIKDQIPVLPYCGCEPMHCYLEPQRPLAEIQISSNCFCDQVKLQWHEKALLVYVDRSTPGLFHFLAPLRSRSLPLKALKPIVFILGSQPDRNFISFISELPMVYFLVGSIRSINDLIRAGIMCADCLVVLSPPDIPSNTTEYESLADEETIAALHKIARLFPHLRLSVDFTYRYNIRFLYTTPYEQWSLQHLRQMARKGDHLTYLFLPQVASGKAFCGNMLDTLLYQAYQKPHIVNVFRQLLCCKDVDGSGFLWKVVVTDELLKLNTYVRVFQRLVSTLGYIPIAVYRASNIETNFDRKDIKGFSEQEMQNLRVYLQGRLHSLGLPNKVDELQKPQCQNFVFLNPSPDFTLQEDDTIIVIRPSPKNKMSNTPNHNTTGPIDSPIFTSPVPSRSKETPTKDESSFTRMPISSTSSLPTEVRHHEEEPIASQARPPTAPLVHTNSRKLFMQPVTRGSSSGSLPQHFSNSNVDAFVL